MNELSGMVLITRKPTPKKLTLRYVVEGKFSKTFTATKKVKDENEAYKIIVSLGLLNLKAGYKKYSNPVLYDDNNNRIKQLSL